MRVLNLRIGFATNSSSSHSIIYVPSNLIPASDGGNDDDSYGWGNFTLVDRDEKMHYIASQLAYTFDRLAVPKYLQDAFFKDHFETDLGDLLPVDHQSVWTFPTVPVDRAPQLPLEWIEDLKTYIAENPNVVILGGNDNSDAHPMVRELGLEDAEDDEIPAACGDVPRFISLDNGDSFTKMRREMPGLWTFYDAKSGRKVTLDLDTTRQARPRSITPELVDIKITDFCPFGCAFCYQGSTTQGRHADVLPDYSNRNQKMPLSEIVQMCADNGVFEIAYGGGEPTLHPNFIEILRMTHDAGITPSFTTKNLAWFRQERVVLEALQYVGGIAFSVDDVAQIAAWGRIAALYGGNTWRSPNRFTIHIVMGVQTLEQLESMLKAASTHKLHVTLLGYKTTGRGNEVTPHPYDGWVERAHALMSEQACPSISVDTALAATHGHELEAHSFPHWLYYTREGQHSAYVDAVAGKIGISSYAPKETLIDLPQRSFDPNFDAVWQDILTAAEQCPLP